jgi:ATP-dependent DNA helicase RecG
MKMEELIAILRKGESEKIEFKSNFVKDITKGICAFSNMDGGDILLGIGDNGKIIGTKTENMTQKVSDVLAAIHPYPKVKMEEFEVENKKIFHIKVSASDNLHSVGNIVYIRIGRNNRPLTTQEVIEKAAESAIVFFDELPSDAPINAISMSLVNEYLEKRRAVRGVKGMGSIEENLAALKITKNIYGNIRPTRGGLLFFSDNPQEYVPNARARLVWFEDEEMRRYIDSKEFIGPIWKMVDDIEDYFLKNLRVVGGDMVGWKRKEIREYPLEALRETVINSLIHRNYFDSSDVQIFIFPTSIRIKNPGNFPPGITVEAPEHKPRNPQLAQYMYDMGYIEKYGSGINKIKKACSMHPFAEVEFLLKPYRTEVVFRKEKKLEFAETDQRILDALTGIGFATSTEISKVTGLSKVAVVKHLNALILIGAVEKVGKGRATRYSNAAE